MKRTLAWLAGLVGIAALGRALAHRRHPAEEVMPEHLAETAADTAAADPAEELRRKLQAQRPPAPDADPAGEPVSDTLEERRARVHAKAREAIDAMHDDEPAA